MADEQRQSEGPTTKIRLYLRASNLAKSLVGQQPDTLARISLLPAPSKRGTQSHPPPAVPPPGVGVRDDEVVAGADEAVAEGVLDETEVRLSKGLTEGRRTVAFASCQKSTTTG